MDNLAWVFFAIIGFVVGVVAKGHHGGTIGAIIAGMLGGVVGGGVLSWLGVLSDVAYQVGLGHMQIVVSLVMSGIGAALFVAILPLLGLKGGHE